MPTRPRSSGSAAAATRDRVAAAFDAFCAGERLPPATAWKLRVALDELVANILTHGDAGPSSIQVSLRRDGDFAEVVLIDEGTPFDPLGTPPPDLTRPLEAREPGGLGIHLVTSLIDDVRYEWRDGNRLTLRARIDAEAGEDAHADAPGDV